MSPEDRTGALLVFTLCVAALTLVLWIDWVCSRDRGLFAQTSNPLLAADTDVQVGRLSGR